MFSEFPEIEFGSISLTMTALIDLPSQRFETESGHFDFFSTEMFFFQSCWNQHEPAAYLIKDQLSKNQDHLGSEKVILNLISNCLSEQMGDLQRKLAKLNILKNRHV